MGSWANALRECSGIDCRLGEERDRDRKGHAPPRPSLITSSGCHTCQVREARADLSKREFCSFGVSCPVPYALASVAGTSISPALTSTCGSNKPPQAVSRGTVCGRHHCPLSTASWQDQHGQDAAGGWVSKPREGGGMGLRAQPRAAARPGPAPAHLT